MKIQNKLRFLDIPELSMTIEKLISSKGYNFQAHNITTEDGYILQIYRILPKDKNNHRVVLLQHGLFDSSDSWVINKKNLSLPFVLADEGYDVWLGNNRGNKHSRGHIKLNPDKDKAYWNFSFHEMGVIDIPSAIDYITLISKVKNITYIGHSQGSTQLFSALTIKPEYFKEKLNGFIALGPVTTLNNIKSSFLKAMADFKVDDLFSFLRINEILPSPESVHKFSSIICDKLFVLCDGLLEVLSDSNSRNNSKESLLVFISHFPSGASQQSLNHFGKIIRKKAFIKREGDEVYDLDNITYLPIALLVGKDDKLSTVEDSRILRNKLLKNNVIHFYKEYDKMGHATFFLNKTTEHIKDILRLLNDFHNF